jgi:hypothetical protein
LYRELNGDTMDHSPAPASTPSRLTQVKVYGIWFVVGLLIGVLPLAVRLIQTQRERDALQQQLQVARLEMNLASAALMARHGDYTAARDAASQFFSDARRAVDGGDDRLSAAQRTNLQTALAERDALITLLARGDPAGAERSTAMYVAHRGAFPR